MEFILIHTPNSNMSPATMPALIEMGKQVAAKPEQSVPGAKMLAAYSAQAKMFMVCLWEAPSIDVIMPALEQMAMMGFDTEVIPADKLEVKMDKLAKAMAEMAKG
jgi:hypothetical protein